VRLVRICLLSSKVMILLWSMLVFVCLCLLRKMMFWLDRIVFLICGIIVVS